MPKQSLQLLAWMLTLIALSATGCASRPDLLPEMGIVHQIAEPVDVVLLVESPTHGLYVRKDVTFPAGSWIRFRTDTPLPPPEAIAGDSSHSTK